MTGTRADSRHTYPKQRGDDAPDGSQYALTVGDDKLLAALRKHHTARDVVVVRARSARRERMKAQAIASPTAGSP